MSGMIGTACVSEYSPDQEIIFKEDELQTFFTKEECVKILRKFQLPVELKKKKADFIIRNNFKSNSIKKSVKIVLRKILLNA